MIYYIIILLFLNKENFMGNIILFIITLTIISLTLYFIYKSTEKSNSLVEKISYIVLAIVDSAILIIYYFDRFNVPTELGKKKKFLYFFFFYYIFPFPFISRLFIARLFYNFLYFPFVFYVFSLALH